MTSALRLFLAILGLIAACLPIAASADGDEAEPVSERRPYLVEFGVHIPTRDGTELSATIIRPADGKPAPLVLTFTPYGRDRYHPVGTFFAKHGYAAAIVDVRGRGDSGGQFVPYVNDGDDGHDVVEWLARQPYTDGRIVMRGASYSGAVQWMVAARRPRGLAAIVPAAPPYWGVDSPAYRGVETPWRLRWYSLVAGRDRNTNFNEDMAYWRGLFSEAARGEIPWADLDDAAGMPNDYWQSMQDETGRRRDQVDLLPTPEQLRAVDIPVLAITGMLDGAQLGTISHFESLRAAKGAQAENAYFLMGPWTHGGVSNLQGSAGGLEFGKAAEREPLEIQLAFFDWVLGRADRPEFLEGQVNYYVLGAREWRSAESLQAGKDDLRFVLAAAGDNPDSLDHVGGLLPPGSRGGKKRGSDHFIYDPRRAPISWLPYFGGAAGGQEYLLDDPYPLRLNGDGLVYQTEPFARPVDIVGNPLLTASISLSTTDTDLAAVLYDIAPDGSSVTIAHDMFRVKWRDLGTEPKPVAPGKATQMQFRFSWTGYRIEQGHRLRLLVTSPGVSMWVHRHPNGAIPANREEPEARTPITVSLHRGMSLLSVPATPIGPQ